MTWRERIAKAREEAYLGHVAKWAPKALDRLVASMELGRYDSCGTAYDEADGSVHHAITAEAGLFAKAVAEDGSENAARIMFEDTFDDYEFDDSWMGMPQFEEFGGPDD